MKKLYTLKGTPIKRSKYGVGKQVGSKIYVHKDYSNSVVLPCMLRAYEACLPRDFEYETIVYDKKLKTIRFDEAPDFCSAPEPHPGITYTVTESGEVTRRVVNQIWHHKWMWVDDDFEGFDVEESYLRSGAWLIKLAEVASGHPGKWLEQLKKYKVKI